MIIHLESSIVEGYLSNEVPGFVTGLLQLAGRRVPTRIELQGNFLQDIAGCRVDFQNPSPAEDPHLTEGLQPLQKGHSGIMTGSYRVVSLSHRHVTGSTMNNSPQVDSSGLKNLAFFEWFNEDNQRILIQSWLLHLSVSAPRWRLSQQEERRLLKQNLARRRHFQLNHHDSHATPESTDPFANDLMELPPGFDSLTDPFNLKPKPLSSNTAADEAATPPDPLQRCAVLAQEMRRFERLMLFHNDVTSQPEVMRLIATVADLAAHLSHKLRQFAASQRANWDSLAVDLGQALPMFVAALAASGELTQAPHETQLDRNWLGLLQSCLHSIEWQMKDILSLLR